MNITSKNARRNRGLSLNPGRGTTPCVGMVALALLYACGSPSTNPSSTQTDTEATNPVPADAGTTSLDASITADGGNVNDASTASIPAGPLFLSGRFDSNSAVSWPGASIRANFFGTSVSVTLGETGDSYFDVMIDGQLTATLALAMGTNTYPLATGLSDGAHTVELYRRSEAIYGTTTFMGFDFGNGQSLPTPSPFIHRMEFLGDSLTAGFGVECTDPSQTNTAATQNEHKSFASLAADALSAEHYNLAYSGTGVYWNYVRTDPQVYGLDYPRTHPAEGAASPAWDFTRWTPDLVWMMIGSNDWDEQSTSDPPPPLAGYVEKYQELVTFVRAQYPVAEIFLVVPPDASDDYPVGYNDLTNLRASIATIKATQAALGDTKVTTFEFTNSNRAIDLTGCADHPSASRQASMAAEAVTAIKQTMQW